MEQISRVPRQPSSLREQVTANLREAILDGRLRPGQKLVERELCTLLDISRALLREALQRLHAEGLVTSVLHRGPSVAIIGAEEVRDIYEVRKALESVAGASFARNASEEQVRALREKFELLKTPEAAESPRAMLLAKNAFYAVLLEGCGNQVIGQVLTQLNNKMMLFKRLSLGAPGRIPQMIDEVGEIVAAIEARDTERASILSGIHVANAARTVMRQLESGRSIEQEYDGQGDVRQRA